MHTFIARLWPVFVVAFVAVYASGTSLMLAKTALMQEDPNLDAIVTGGGTVSVTALQVASFGVNAKRPPGFAPGEARGRINYDRHFIAAGGRHVNAAVSQMQATATNTPPNHTGGDATLLADCRVPDAECIGSPDTKYVLVYVKDSADNGSNDMFEIFFCSLEPVQLPDPSTFPAVPPTGCAGPEGGNLRSGNVQIRPR